MNVFLTLVVLSAPHASLGARASGAHGAECGWNPSFGASAHHRGQVPNPPLQCGDGHDRRDNRENVCAFPLGARASCPRSRDGRGPTSQASGSASRWRAVCGKRLGARASGAHSMGSAREREPLARIVRERPGSASLWSALCGRDQGAQASGAHCVGETREREPLARIVWEAPGSASRWHALCERDQGARASGAHSMGGTWEREPLARSV